MGAASEYSAVLQDLINTMPGRAAKVAVPPGSVLGTCIDEEGLIIRVDGGGCVAQLGLMRGWRVIGCDGHLFSEARLRAACSSGGQIVCTTYERDEGVYSPSVEEDSDSDQSDWLPEHDRRYKRTSQAQSAKSNRGRVRRPKSGLEFIEEEKRFGLDGKRVRIVRRRVGNASVDEMKKLVEEEACIQAEEEEEEAKEEASDASE